MRCRVILLLLACACFSPFPAYATHLGFKVAFQGLESDLDILSTSVMPGKTLRLKTVAAVTSDTGSLDKNGNDWVWTAPSSPGRSVLVLTHRGETMRLNVFVLTPFKNGEQTSLNGYRIGRYASTLFRGLSSYAAPQGFINMAHGSEDMQISPHFTLGQFPCKQQQNHEPVFLLVHTAMLIKLEALLEAANRKGWQADTFYIMSGFRTPEYNRSIGNDTTSSRHLYGDAADIWIDHDGDGQMDDLDGDGRITRGDAEALAGLAEMLGKKGGATWPSGGIGIYEANAAHGPFVHIDARGYRARW